MRQPLERWEMLPPNSPKEAIRRFGLDVQKIASPHSDPATAILHLETSAQNFGMAPVSAEKLISRTSPLAAPRKASEWIPDISPDC